jgi:hypothetical protein
MCTEVRTRRFYTKSVCYAAFAERRRTCQSRVCWRCTHHFRPLRKNGPLVITAENEHIPKVVLLECGAQVVGDEVSLFLGGITTAVDAEVDIVTVSRLILSCQAPDIDTFPLVSLQEAVTHIKANITRC